VTTAAPDWYDDPDRPGQKRYWDGDTWTEHRTAYPPAAPAKPKEKFLSADGKDESGFGLVVAGVLGGAVALIVAILTVVVWFDSYNTGHARGVEAGKLGVPKSTASEYCNATAKDLSSPGSADGYWDMPWVIGCKRGLG